ncbi:MAG: ribosome biogenesis GTPase Der [Thermoguttaceae bacterium]|jgi:GTP-binding protein
MGVAKVAIIGRPNVGKSSLFNWLIGERLSVVDSVAGVTRDRVSFLLDIGLDGVDEKYLIPEVIDSETTPLNSSDDVVVDKETERELVVDKVAPFEPVESSEELESDSDEESDPDAFLPPPSEGDGQGSVETSEGREYEGAILADEDSALESDDSEGTPEEKKRPRISARYIELTDTGGVGIVDKDDLSDDVEMQIDAAIRAADLILFVVDARDGITPLDQFVAERLRPLKIPIVLVANKCDGDAQKIDAAEFHSFGWGVVPVSAKQKRGRVNLMETIEKALPVSAFFDDGEKIEEPEMRIAIVGRRNVGKSTFINTLVKEERVIASPIPGTTRDCVDVRFEMDGKSFVAVDTPGFMRKKSIASDVDFYALTRAERSIRTADVVLMFFDCSLQISKMDKQLVSLIESYNKPCIFVVNKWDKMVKYKMPTSRWADYLRETFATMWHVPIAFITGMTGKNVQKLLQHARFLFRQSQTRIPTNLLNKLITAAMNHTAPPLFHFRKPKIYYATQISVAPPTIVLFCNIPEAFTPSYRRFLLNVIRDELPIGEVPIRLWFRKRESNDTQDAVESKRLS